MLPKFVTLWLYSRLSNFMDLVVGLMGYALSLTLRFIKIRKKLTGNLFSHTIPHTGHLQTTALKKIKR